MLVPVLLILQDLIYMRLVIIFFFLIGITSCKDQESAEEDRRNKLIFNGMIGTWNVLEIESNYQNIDLVISIFNFDKNNDCQIPFRMGIPSAVVDGTWSPIIKNGRPHVFLEVNDTLFNGLWEIKNVRYSQVKGYQNFLLKCEMHNESTKIKLSK